MANIRQSIRGNATPESNLQKRGLSDRMYKSGFALEDNAKRKAETFYGMNYMDVNQRPIQRKQQSGQFVSQNWKKFLR